MNSVCKLCVFIWAAMTIYIYSCALLFFVLFIIRWETLTVELTHVYGRQFWYRYGRLYVFVRRIKRRVKGERRNGIVIAGGYRHWNAVHFSPLYIHPSPTWKFFFLSVNSSFSSTCCRPPRNNKNELLLDTFLSTAVAVARENKR